MYVIGVILYQVLHDFPHATSNIAPEYLLDMIGPLRPRAFSIASSQQVQLITLQWTCTIHADTGT